MSATIINVGTERGVPNCTGILKRVQKCIRVFERIDVADPERVRHRLDNAWIVIAVVDDRR